MEPQWTKVFDASELAGGDVRLVNVATNRISVFRRDTGELHALDDRCPHEGYPLCQGTVSGDVLTCCFHNFKFQLSTGACLVGDERVRTYPVREVDGMVEIDVAPVDPAVELPRRWASLESALHEERMGQIAREVVRLLDLGVPVRTLAQHAAAWDCARGQWGNSHAPAVAADAVVLAPDGLEAARVLIVAYEMAARRNVRRKPHPTPDALDPGGLEDFPTILSAAVEAEDVDRALGLLRGGLERGWTVPQLEPALLRLASDHFLDFGHALIYATKLQELLTGATPAVTWSVVSGVVRGIVYGTREDTLPAWSGWRRQTAAVADRWTAWSAGTGPVPDPGALREALLDGTKQAALQAVFTALDAGASPGAVATELAHTAAERFLRFDVAHDLDPEVQDTWLSVTHVQTFCHAVRAAMASWSDPRRVRLLFQAARMVAMTRPLDRVDPPGPAQPSPPAAVVAAIRDGAADLAAARAEGCTDREALRGHVLSLVLSDPVVRPIYAAHALKQTRAAFEDAEALGTMRPVAALVRFLAAPRQERRTGQLVSDAIRLVRDGATPRVLAR